MIRVQPLGELLDFLQPQILAFQVLLPNELRQLGVVDTLAGHIGCQRGDLFELFFLFDDIFLPQKVIEHFTFLDFVENLALDL